MKTMVTMVFGMLTGQSRPSFEHTDFSAWGVRFVIDSWIDFTRVHVWPVSPSALSSQLQNLKLNIRVGEELPKHNQGPRWGDAWCNG